MTQLKNGDLAIVAGPLEWCNDLHDSTHRQSDVKLIVGEVVEVLDDGEFDDYGTLFVRGRESNHSQHIQATSLRSWDDLCNDDSVEWGEIDLDGEIEISIPVYE